jgi:hypothetical protein
MDKGEWKMAEEQEQKPAEESEEIEKTIDPYTGELKPVPEDADQFIEVVPESTDDREGQNYLLNEETSMDAYAANADADAVAEQSAHYTEDEDIEEDFADRQRLAASGRDELLEELENHNSLSPAISGGDLDASWQTANQAGEETVGGSVSTPDQDVVDELGEAAGITYRDDEPLDYSKVLDRDRDRWELNPASAQDGESEAEAEDELEEDDILDDLEGLDELDEDEEGLDDEEELDDDELEDDDELDEDLDDEDEEDYIDAEPEDEEEDDNV